MVNENVNVQDDKLKKFLESDGIKSQEISNFDDFKNYSKDELLQMKKDSETDKTLTEEERNRVLRNIGKILEVRVKEEKSLQSQKDEEERKKTQKEINEKKQEEKEKQDEKVEDLKKQLESSEETSQDSVQEEVQEITQESTPEQGKSSAKQEENKEGEIPAEENKEEENKEGETPAEENKEEEDKEGETVSEENKEEENKEGETKEKGENYQEQIDSLKKSNEELRKKIDNQTKIINALLAIRAKRNAEAINKMKEELRKSREEATKLKQERDKLLINNKKMKDLYFGELPKYNGHIVPLKTKAVEFKFGVNRIEGDQRVLSMPQLRLRKNIVSRHRLNTTIKKLNEIGDDPKRGVNYILTKADFLKGGAKIGTLCKKVGNYFKIRDVDSFDQKFNEQKKIFINDLEAKMQGRMSEDDRKTLKAVKDRLDYYQKAYKRKFLTV